MEIVLEQFIPSDKPKTSSNILKKVSIIFLVIALISIFMSILITLVFGIISLLLFIGSYITYVDYEYELFNEDITITKIYNASRRKVVQKFSKDQVRRVYSISGNSIDKNIKMYYNTNIKNLKIYKFELENNEIIQLALNNEFEKIIKIIYAQRITY